MWTAKTLIRLSRCLGWSESSLGAHAILLVLSWGGSNAILLWLHRKLIELNLLLPQTGNQSWTESLWNLLICTWRRVWRRSSCSIILRDEIPWENHESWLGSTCGFQESTDLGCVTTTLPLLQIPGIHWPWLGDHYPATWGFQESTDIGWVTTTLPLAESWNPLTLVGWPLPCHLRIPGIHWHWLWPLSCHLGIPGIHWPWLGDHYPATCGFQESTDLGWMTTTLALTDSRNPLTYVGWLLPATCRLQESTDLGWVTLPLADFRNPLTLVGWPLPCHLRIPGIHWHWLGDHYPASCGFQDPLTLVGWPLPCHLRIPGIHWPWLCDHYPATWGFQESTDLGWVTTTLPLADSRNPLTLVGWPLP